MGQTSPDPSIDRTSARDLFTELVGEAVAEVHADPSPLATRYLVDLLEQLLQSPQLSPRGEDGAPTLGEAFLLAHRQPGSARAAMLRSLGDRVLFVAGFFSESLQRGLVGERYYREIGSSAYAGLSSLLRGASQWSAMFEELAEEFPVFVAVMSEVGARSRGEADPDLLALCDRFVAGGSPRDRAKLLRSGLALPDRRGWRLLQ